LAPRCCFCSPSFDSIGRRPARSLGHHQPGQRGTAGSDQPRRPGVCHRCQRGRHDHAHRVRHVRSARERWRVECRDRGRHLDDLQRRKRHLRGHVAGQLGIGRPPDGEPQHRQHRRRHGDERCRRPRCRVLGRHPGRPDGGLPRPWRAAGDLRGHCDHEGLQHVLQRWGPCGRGGREPHDLRRAIDRTDQRREALRASLLA